MRLGIIGWYGHANPGDERILQCLKRLFDGDTILPTRGLDDALDRIEELNECDYVLFGGGGLVLRGTGRYAELFERLKPPFSAIGLGVEYRDASNQRLLDVLVSRAELIHVRDQASCERLDRDPKVIAGADLTFLYPFDVADWTETERCSLNLRPWTPAIPRRSGWVGRLLDLAAPEAPERWQPAAAVERVRTRFEHITPLPLYAEPGESSDAELLTEFVGPCEPAFDPQLIANSRYLVAMRLHALIFACQMGIPFVSLSYQPKNRALCAELRMEWASVPLGRLDALAEALDRLSSGAREHRNALLEQREESVQRCWKSVEPVVALVRARAR